MWKKTEPQITRLRKSIMFVAILIIFAIVFLILGIIFGSYKKGNEKIEKKVTPVHKLASSSDTQWMHDKSNSSTQNHTLTVSSNSVNQMPTSDKEAPNNNVVQSSDESNSNNDDTLKKAMTAPIGANQLSYETATISTNNTTSTPLSQNGVVANNDDQNMQSEKKDFLQMNNHPNPDDYLGSELQNPVSPYEIQAGTIIPGILLTGINSDLPGQITAQVRSNVFDSISGRYVLIPQGAKLTGLYDSQISYGQQRILIVWNRIIYPNGKSIDLQGMPGVDMSGYAGFNDLVNNHYMQIFSSVLLMSVLSAGVQLSQPQDQGFNPYAGPTVGQTLAQSLGTNIANTGTMIAQKSINVQPTLIIRPGYKFNISVTKDMVFPGEYDVQTNE